MEKEREGVGKGLIYEVPEDLRYEERLIWVFTAKQAAIFSIFLVIAISIFTKTGLDLKLRAASSFSILVFGLVFSISKPVQEQVVKRFKYLVAPKRGSWTDSWVLNEYVGIKSISHQAVIMQDGRLLSILLVTPIDFSVLSDEQKLALISSYKTYLNSLSFSVQILMRTTKVNLQEYFATAKAKMAHARDKTAMEEMERFQEFVEDFISSRGVNDRLFYIIIPQPPSGNLEQDAVELTRKVQIVREKLAVSGLAATSLAENSLITLYASYFGGYVEVEADYLSLVTMLDMASGEYANLRKMDEKLRQRALLMDIGGGKQK